MVVSLRTCGHTLSILTKSLERLCSKEDRMWKERIFNKNNSDEVNICQRNCAATWLRKVSSSMHFAFDTFALTIDLLDRLLATLKVRPIFLECLCVACLYIAAKYKEEDETISITPQFVVDCNCNCTTNELLRMETIILDKFDWFADFVTSIDFLEIYFSIVLLKIVDGEEKPNEEIFVNKYQNLEIELSSCLQHHCLASFKPRILALALISLELERQQSQINFDWLSSITYLQRLAKIENDDLLSCRHLIVRSLSSYKVIRLELSDLKFLSHIYDPLRSQNNSSNRPSYADVLCGRTVHSEQ